MKTVPVPGGSVVLCDIFSADFAPPEFAMAVADPPYGGKIVTAKWDKIGAKALATSLRVMAETLSKLALPGAHLWLWGGIGTPNQRALYRALVGIEDDGAWQCAEQITWKKHRAYGTDWRCLMTREECLRFVLGDAKKPRVYHVQLTEEERGYAGFNAKYPAKSKFKRLTAIWDHASDMGQNKPHECHKPGPLARSQILSTTNEGDTVLDLFSGSGQVSLTARELGRPFAAYEADAEEFERLIVRLQ